MQINNQPAEPLVDYTTLLDLISVYKTIQGEGPFIGWPAVFVRLAGCNLRCPMCDTNYTVGRKPMSVLSIISLIEQVRFGPIQTVESKLSHPAKLIVFSGGEPLRQDISNICIKLVDSGLLVQIETNGTIHRGCLDLLRPSGLFKVVCSPKTGKLHPLLKPDAYKYVVQAGHTCPEDGLPLSVLGKPVRVARPHNDDVDIFIQPLDCQDEDENKRNLHHALEICDRFGYRLCPQVHKMIGLD